MQSAINKDARPLNLILFKTDFIKELFLVSNTKLFQYLFFFFLDLLLLLVESTHQDVWHRWFKLIFSGWKHYNGNFVRFATT